MRDIDIIRFKRIPLRVHSFLAGIPLRTLERMELLGGPEGMTLSEIKAIVENESEGGFEAGPVTRALFWLRGLIGHILHWDDSVELVEYVTYLPRLTDEDRTRSLIAPGKVEGISRGLYCFENEFLAEIINRTVHCFWVMASESTEKGYALYLAVYVKNLNWFTPIYTALITPMLKWIVYPSMFKGLRRRWDKAFSAGPGPSEVPVAAK